MEIDQNALVILDQLRGDQRLKKVLENQSIHVLGILSQDNLDNDNHPRVVVLCRKHGTISRRRLDQAHKGCCYLNSRGGNQHKNDREYIDKHLKGALAYTSAKFVEKTGNDKSNWRVELSGENYKLSCRTKNLYINAIRIVGYLKKIKVRHGANVDFYVTFENGKSLVDAKCLILGNVINTKSVKVLLEWAPRADPKVLERLQRKFDRRKQKLSEYLEESFIGVVKRSQPERKVLKALQELGEPLLEQVWFPDLSDKRVLRFDFMLPCGLLLEVDTIIHSQANPKMGGERGLEQRERRDKLKDDYAKTLPSRKFALHRIKDADKKDLGSIKAEIDKTLKQYRADRGIPDYSGK
jgi:hypothetical protein